MAVIITREIKRKRILLTVFTVLVLASALILYLGYFGESIPVPVTPAASLPAAGGTAAANQISDLKVKILEDNRFKNLELPPGVPIRTETTGKSNPFSD